MLKMLDLIFLCFFFFKYINASNKTPGIYTYIQKTHNVINIHTKTKKKYMNTVTLIYNDGIHEQKFIKENIFNSIFVLCIYNICLIFFYRF